MNTVNKSAKPKATEIPQQAPVLLEPTPDEIFQRIIDYLSLVTHESDLDRQLMLLADLGREITRSDRCTVWINEPKEMTLWTKVAHGINRVILPESMGIVGACFSSGEDIIINDAYSDPRFDMHTDQKTGYLTKNILALPLRDSTGKIIGVFQAINKLSKHQEYSPLDVQRAFLIASYVGRMLETCILYNEIRESRELQRKSQERLKIILEATNDGFWDWSISNNEFFVSPGWVKFITGKESTSGFVELARSNVHADDSQMVEAIFMDQLSPESDSYEVEYRVHTWDGKIKWVEERGRVMEWSGDGSVNRLVGTFKDVTQRRMALHEKIKLEAQLQHVQRLESLGIMAGGVAHDYNNMLSTIIGNTEIAILDSADDSPIVPYLEQIKIAAQRSSDLTRQLLNYSGGGKFVVAPINLNTMIKEILELVKASLSKKAELKISMLESLPEIEGDISQIRQVLMNLIINASDSLKNESGIVQISTAVQKINPDCFWLYTPEALPEFANESYVTLTVKDTGCGIEEKNLRKIFEPFFSTKDTGRGLGLAAVIGIVKSHRGGLSVDSKIGVGTEFVVQIPVRKAAPGEKTNIAQQIVEDKKFGSGNIIVADDEESLLLVLQRILIKAGYKVYPAKNGAAAWELFKTHGIAIDLLLLDTNMPEMSGPEVLKKVREVDPTVPVILLSGYSQTPAGDEESTPDAFVHKPFSRQAILQIVKEKLESKRPG